MLSPRTVLNGGERGQEHGRGAKEDWKTRHRTNLNGGDLVRSTFLVLTFTSTFAFEAILVLALILTFFAPFGGSIFTLLGCNGEKRRIVSRRGEVRFGAFGWTLACAHIGLIGRVAFYWILFTARVYGERRGSGRGRSPCRE